MTRSCATCDWVDTALRDGEVVLECHLSPPTTMPLAPPLPPVETETESVEVLAFAEPHRYPVVTESDWCSEHRQADRSER